MGWSIETRTVKNRTQYRFYSNTSDTYISKWGSKKDMIKFLFWSELSKFQKNFIEEAMSFPEGWHNKKTGKALRNAEGKEKFFDFIFKETRKDYYGSIEKKFNELANDAGVKITVDEIKKPVVKAKAKKK